MMGVSQTSRGMFIAERSNDPTLSVADR